MFGISNASQYADTWGNESDFLESHGIYEKLAELVPDGNVLEVGCGVGNGTQYLVKSNKVLSLDSNESLIKTAQERFKNKCIESSIIQCDLFDLTESVIEEISSFMPRTIVGWFIGSNGEDIFSRTEEENDISNKSKLYREKIEDIIVSNDLCTDSVDYIHLVNRGVTADGFTKEELFKDTKDDYDQWVFKPAGFEVVSVEQLLWPRDGSEFAYGESPNPNFVGGNITPSITSIIAKRIE
ncbi:class I SAM-dependent methyltransferase [Vibrio diabolicus]|uniref:class I SAM-dependent methyltransferase n=1 Tax=Vibrio diabolicus TaxID=50719 RepID=UPI0037545181